MNCGRCGRPIFNGQPICDFCKKTFSKDATKHSTRMNKRKDQEEELLMNMTAPGKDEDTKEDMKYQHYVDSHDASAVWAQDDPKRKKH